MTGILILFAVFGYATAAGAARHLHAAEFDDASPAHRRLAEEQMRRAAVMVFWPIVMPVMLGILMCRRAANRIRAGAEKKDRLAAEGGIMLGPEIEIRDSETYRRLTIAVQKYERERGYDRP